MCGWVDDEMSTTRRCKPQTLDWQKDLKLVLGSALGYCDDCK